MILPVASVGVLVKEVNSLVVSVYVLVTEMISPVASADVLVKEVSTSPAVSVGVRV